jgi:curved DNA-binding protein CbpA
MRYHPDRNPAPEAATIMARINQAYAILSGASRRCKYDRQQRMSCSSDFALPILSAARDTVLRQRWTVLIDDGSQVLLEESSRRVRVTFVERLTTEKLRKLSRQYTEFGVVLAVEV